MMRPAKSEDILSRKIIGRLLLVPVRGKLADMQELYMPNETGEFIWNMLDGKHSVDNIAAALAEEFNVPQDEAMRDAHEFVGWLIKRGLVQEV